MFSKSRRGPGVRPVARAVVVVLALASVTAAAQSEVQFVISAADASGRPVTDLARKEIVMSEGGLVSETIRVAPYHVPVRLTIAVDNGPLSADALSHYRSGLAGLVKALPQDIEVTLIAISPQPRMVVRPTTDRLRILRGINEFAPEEASPRFTDAIVEFSNRLRGEMEETGRFDFLPVMVMVSTTVNDAVSYEVPEIERALGFLGWRKARVYMAVLTAGNNSATAINANRQAIIGIPTTEITRGRYESLAASSRLQTLLPEFGRDIAAMHRRSANQLLVTVERHIGLSGPITNPRVELTRPGLTGQVSLDGLP
jgi:hypothetical protein